MVDHPESSFVPASSAPVGHLEVPAHPVLIDPASEPPAAEPNSARTTPGGELPRARVVIPGGGILESIGWMLLVLALNVATAILSVVIQLVWLAATDPEFEASKLESSIATLELSPPRLYLESLMWTVSVAFCCWLRLRPQAARRVNLGPIPVNHGLLMLASVAPFSVISGTCYYLASVPWNALVEMFPALGVVDQLNSMPIVVEISRRMPPLGMLFVIAVSPAILEELVFRGVIGRMLLARYGWIAGGLVTSALFASLHVHPVHAAGVFPLGCLFHFVYWSSRSFCAPMAWHFLNNSLAVIALSQAAPGADPLTELNEAPALFLTLTAFLAGAAAVWYFWQSRIEYRLPDEREWSPPYPTLSGPPVSLGARRVQRRAQTEATLAVWVSLMLFYAANFLSAPATSPSEPAPSGPPACVQLDR